MNKKYRLSVGKVESGIPISTKEKHVVMFELRPVDRMNELNNIIQKNARS